MVATDQYHSIIMADILLNGFNLIIFEYDQIMLSFCHRISGEGVC